MARFACARLYEHTTTGHINREDHAMVELSNIGTFPWRWCDSSSTIVEFAIGLISRDSFRNQETYQLIRTRFASIHFVNLGTLAFNLCHFQFTVYLIFEELSRCMPSFTTALALSIHRESKQCPFHLMGSRITVYPWRSENNRLSRKIHPDSSDTRHSKFHCETIILVLCMSSFSTSISTMTLPSTHELRD